MSLLIRQSPESKKTYQFDLDNLDGKTISSVVLSSVKLALTNELNTTTSFSFTADSTGQTGSAKVKVIIMLSNGDKEVKSIGFSIAPEYL